jgi:transposase
MEIKRNPKAHSNGRGWSTADDSTLIKMARGGASAPEIAKILGRTIKSITTRKYTLGVDVRLKSSKNGQNLDVPKSLSVHSKSRRKELPIKVISRTPISQPAAVNTAKKKIWTPQDDAELVKLSAEGKTSKFIAKILGRTPVAVTVRKYALKREGKLITKQTDKKVDAKVDTKKTAMLLRMEKMRAAKGKNKNLPKVEKVVSVPVLKAKNVTSAGNLVDQPIIESDFDALSRIAKSTGATITMVFNK